jgi:hypothetical protein
MRIDRPIPESKSSRPPFQLPTSSHSKRVMASAAVVLALAASGCRDTKATDPATNSINPTTAQASNAATARAALATKGEWGAAFSWGGETQALGIHLHLLLDGKVLTFGHSGQPSVWNPAVPSVFNTLPAPVNVFCSGHAFLSDGRLLLTGGHDDTRGDDVGVRYLNIFDHNTQTWIPQDSLALGRWYPSSVTMPNGDVVTVGGTKPNKDQEPIPEIYNGITGASRALTGASYLFSEPTASYYPRIFLAPNGLVFYAGYEPQSRWLDVRGDGSWTNGPVMNGGLRDYGSAVMYDNGKILTMGGGYAPTNSAEVIDLNQGSPSWRLVGSMAKPRRQLNATLLADGKVLVNGGTSATGFTEESGAVFESEIWDPATETWRTVASARVIRVYHSAALLLADGRVVATGGGEGSTATPQKVAEIYTPPYLYDKKGKLAVRPTISAAPAEVNYGQSFTVSTPQASTISQVTWIRLGSVTHAWNQSQRFSRLPFTRSTSSITLTAPTSPTLSPPGPYLLFVFDGSGVPSIAKIVKIK